MKEDFQNWQNNVREDWKEGVKTWNRQIIKGTLMFLLAMIPIIVVLLLVIAILNPILNPP